MPIHGVASALHGTDSLLFTTSIVRAERKDDIELTDVWREKMEADSMSSIRSIIERYVETVRNVVSLQQSESASIPVPVAYCTQDGPLTEVVSESMRAGDAHIGLEADESHISHIGSFVHSRIRQVIEEPDAFSFHLRGYLPHAFGCDVDLKRRETKIEVRKRQKRDAWLRSLYWKVKNEQSHEALQELHEAIDILAEQYASRYTDAGGDASTRFFLIGSHVPEHKNDMQYNMIQWFDLRQRFAKKLMQILNISHHICVKAPLDPPSPPTADITATYLADLLGGEQCAVMVKSRDGYKGEQTRCV